MNSRRRRLTCLAAVASIGAVAAVMFWQPLAALAKPGEVTTDDGHTYLGDVSEDGQIVTIVDDSGSKIQMNKGKVQATVYFENHQQEFNARMRELGPKDVRGRIAVARWAMKQKEDGLAAQALDSALKIEPNNVEASTLRKSLAPATPTQPATNPTKAAAVKPRLVTKDEINRIRQVEWQPTDDAVRVTIDKETKQTFLARSRDLTPAQFNKMTPGEQGREILKHGTDQMREGVHLQTDPAPILNYRRNIQKMVLTGCAAGGCHDSASKTGFSLYTEANDEAAYTNYLILQSYRTKVKDRVRLMIDRDQPDESLLSEFALAPKISNTPHPDVPNYVGVFRGVQNPQYKMLTQWIHAMPTVAPSYGVDLTKPPETNKPAAAPAPAAPVPATPAPAPAPPAAPKQ